MGSNSAFKGLSYTSSPVPIQPHILRYYLQLKWKLASKFLDNLTDLFIMLKRCIQQIILRKYKLILNLSDNNCILFITF
jgi:hypothetical protein